MRNEPVVFEDDGRGLRVQGDAIGAEVGRSKFRPRVF